MRLGEITQGVREVQRLSPTDCKFEGQRNGDESVSRLRRPSSEAEGKADTKSKEGKTVSNTSYRLGQM